MDADYARDRRRAWRRADHGCRSSAQRGEDGRRDRSMALVAGMEPVGPSQIARATIRGMKIVDHIEAIQADERAAVPRTGAGDDGIEIRRWQPASDAQH